MAIITPQLLLSLRTGLVKIFQDSLRDTPTQWQRVATLVPSSTASNSYGWLGQFPALREWVGERVIKDMKAQAYAIENKLYEGTVGVKRTDLEDDNLGIYTPLTQEQGRAAATHPDALVFALLKSGHASLCYDGQNFFDTDHPVYPNADGTGTASAVGNVHTGAGPAWYLLDTTRPLKPLIYQERTRPELQALMNVDDEQVFMSDLYRFGIRARCNVGFGFWQMAHKSTAVLDEEGFTAAREAMETLTADGGRPLGITPNLLVVPPTLRSQAEKLLLAAQQAGGATNTNYKAVDLLVTPWLM